MKELLEYLVKNIVEDASSVEVEEIAGRDIIILQIRVNPRDFGKVIGKNGKTIDALRWIVFTVAHRFRKKVVLEMIEPEGREE